MATTKVYVMATCPDCKGLKERLEGNPDYDVIDIGQHVRNLKEFLKLRDNNPAFARIVAAGAVGIPCIVAPGGEISFSADGLKPDAKPQGAACSLDGKGC